MKREAVIVSAVRTGVGRMRGVFSNVPDEVLAGTVMKEAVVRAKIDPKEIDEIYFGCLSGIKFGNFARYAALLAELPIEVPAMTIDRQCGTALNAMALGARMIESGYYDVVLAGGANSDTRRPWVVEKPDSTFPNKPLTSYTGDKSSPRKFDSISMLVTAERLAVKYNLTREDCDEFSYTSQQRAAAAYAKGLLKDYIVPVTIDLGKGKTKVVDTDETPRADTTMEGLAKLGIASGVKDGVVTAGNSSPNSDGASAMIVMEKSKAKAMGLKILATFRGFAEAGCDPAIMGIGPAPATRKLLSKVGMKLEDIDLIELNEAFAAQSLAVVKELGIDRNKLNVHGGAIALGHPLAATGGILVAKLVEALEVHNKRWGLVTFCCGGGQGVSCLLEREQ